MSQYEDVVSRCNKMSFLLGLATGGLSEVIDLLNKLMEGVAQLYYPEAKPNE